MSYCNGCHCCSSSSVTCPLNFLRINEVSTYINLSIYVLLSQGEGIQEFLEEGTALDPRFKGKVEDAVWYRLEEELIDRASHQVFKTICIIKSHYI